MRKRVIPWWACLPVPQDISDGTPLGDARAFVHEHAEEGTICPCCKQYVKIYQRVLSSSTARVQIALWQRNEGREYVYIPKLFNTLGDIRGGTGDGTKGRFWGLMEQMDGVREDGSNRVGWWRLTDLGRAFVVGDVTVPKYAHLYNGGCLGLSGPPWSIRDALGTRFNYDELMGHRRRIILRQGVNGY